MGIESADYDAQMGRGLQYLADSCVGSEATGVTTTMIDAVGYAAAILTTASFLPQVFHTWRTRSARDLSWMWLILFGTGLVLWLAYGVAISSWSLVAANSVTFVLVLSLGWAKLFCMKKS